MTGLLWLVLIGIAVTLLFTWLLLIDAVARGRPRGKMRQLAAAYRRFHRVLRNRKRVPCQTATEGGG